MLWARYIERPCTMVAGWSLDFILALKQLPPNIKITARGTKFQDVRIQGTSIVKFFLCVAQLGRYRQLNSKF